MLRKDHQSSLRVLFFCANLHPKKYCSGGVAFYSCHFKSAFSLSNKRQNKILQNKRNNTLHVMYCEGSVRRQARRQAGGRRQAVMVFNAASLRDFAAFSFCRLPSFTVVHPSVDHHRFTLFRRWRSLAADRRAGRQAGPFVAKVKRIISDFSEGSGRWARRRAHYFSENSGGVRRGGQEGGQICSTKFFLKFQWRVGQTGNRVGRCVGLFVAKEKRIISVKASGRWACRRAHL